MLVNFDFKPIFWSLCDFDDEILTDPTAEGVLLGRARRRKAGEIILVPKAVAIVDAARTAGEIPEAAGKSGREGALKQEHGREPSWPCTRAWRMDCHDFHLHPHSRTTSRCRDLFQGCSGLDTVTEKL